MIRTETLNILKSLIESLLALLYFLRQDYFVVYSSLLQSQNFNVILNLLECFHISSHHNQSYTRCCTNVINYHEETKDKVRILNNFIITKFINYGYDLEGNNDFVFWTKSLEKIADGLKKYITDIRKNIYYTIKKNIDYLSKLVTSSIQDTDFANIVSPNRSTTNITDNIYTRYDKIDLLKSSLYLMISNKLSEYLVLSNENKITDKELTFDIINLLNEPPLGHTMPLRDYAITNFIEDSKNIKILYRILYNELSLSSQYKTDKIIIYRGSNDNIESGINTTNIG